MQADDDVSLARAALDEVQVAMNALLFPPPPLVPLVRPSTSRSLCTLRLRWSFQNQI